MADPSGQPTAAGALLGTKLYIPRRRPMVVARPGLIERLDRGAGRRLTLVSAPAGFGKTTLLADWVRRAADGERPAGWLSLDPGDNSVELFWTYVITGLRAVRPEVGNSALSLLRSRQPPPIERVLTALINEISAIGDDPSSAGSRQGVTLVLDDYHVIEAEAAAGLVELAGRAMLTGRQDETFLAWLKALPDELVRHPQAARPSRRRS